MTGKELIVYILKNDLENEPVFENGMLLGFITSIEAAIKFEVGISTIRTWVELGILDGVQIGGEIYIPPNAELKIDK